MALLTLLMFGAFAGDRLYARQSEIELISHGAAVTATITYAENKQNHQPFTSSDKCALTVNWPGNPETLSDVYLTNGGTTGATIMLHVDKTDHTRWTDRSEATPLLDSLFVGLLALPVLPVLLLLGMREMLSLRKLWQNGSAALAIVSDRRQSPIAPQSYAVRCSLREARRRDLFTVYVPRVGSGLQKGDVIWVITSAKKGQPLAALWMPPSMEATDSATPVATAPAAPAAHTTGERSPAAIPPAGPS